MTNSFDRRKFLKRTAYGCASASIAAGGGLIASHKGKNPKAQKINQVRNYTAKKTEPFCVIASGPPAWAVKKAIEELGGIKSFVKKGETVVVKPNVGWDRTPLQAANTNPIVVKTIIELCFLAGAAKVVVTDNTCNDAARSFTRSGIWKMAEEAGATVILPAEHRFRNFDIGGTILGEMPVLVPAVEADRFINVPIAKHHGLSHFTGAMKNLYGILGGRRNRLHQQIDDSIADLADFIRPTLTIMDAIRVLMRNGPQGGNIADTKDIGKIVASTDQVAIDAISCKFIDSKPSDLPYLDIASKRGLGTSDLSAIKIKEISA